MGEVFAGRYELVDPVGRGGVGAVWRAWDHRRRRYVAAKVLQQSDAHSLLRFVREQALRIDHPHVLAPASWAADDDKVLFTMDLVAGGSLVHLVNDYGPLPVPFVCTLLDQLLSGLAAVHAEGVVHRDIKPANVLLEATGAARPRLRLSDFGIAMRLGEPRLTETNYVVGTPGYLAPEQMLGAEPDFPSDLFAVGLVALYLLEGAKPDAKALIEYFAAHGTPGAPQSIPEPLWQVVATLLQPDPDARFRTATGARKALAAAAELLPEPGPDVEPVEVFDQVGPLPDGYGPRGPLKDAPGLEQSGPRADGALPPQGAGTGPHGAGTAPHPSGSGRTPPVPGTAPGTALGTALGTGPLQGGAVGAPTPAGRTPDGATAASSEAAGSGAAGSAVTGSAPGGPTAAGPAPTDPPTTGPVPAGPVSIGPAPAGPVPTGPAPAGPVPAGPVPTGPAPAGPVPAGPVSAPPGMGPVPPLPAAGPLSAPPDAGPVSAPPGTDAAHLPPGTHGTPPPPTGSGTVPPRPGSDALPPSVGTSTGAVPPYPADGAFPPRPDTAPAPPGAQNGTGHPHTGAPPAQGLHGGIPPRPTRDAFSTQSQISHVPHPTAPEDTEAAPDTTAPRPPTMSDTGSFHLPPPQPQPSTPPARPTHVQAPAFVLTHVASPHQPTPTAPATPLPQQASTLTGAYTAPAPQIAPPPRQASARHRTRRPGPPAKVAVPVLLLALLCFAVGFWALTRI
ncbi:protein kinase [Streptomyces sp. NPDC059785]|uniref:protein kinase domain-containing protein n=1 Tax=unclassified Streptomyces TaxID=2593676 RepID=UPI00365C3B6A